MQRNVKISVSLHLEFTLNTFRWCAYLCYNLWIMWCMQLQFDLQTYVTSSLQCLNRPKGVNVILKYSWLRQISNSKVNEKWSDYKVNQLANKQQMLKFICLRFPYLVEFFISSSEIENVLFFSFRTNKNRCKWYSHSLYSPYSSVLYCSYWAQDQKTFRWNF